MPPLDSLLNFQSVKAAWQRASALRREIRGQRYPPQIQSGLNVCFTKRSDSKRVQRALRNGLDPNTLWTEDDLVEPGLTGGCCIPCGLSPKDSWKEWNTPLHLALFVSDYDSAEIILRNGGDINIYNDLGHTALHKAIENQSQATIRFLVQNGVDLDKPARDGLVPLHLALRKGDEEMFFSLLQDGARLQAAAHLEWSIVDLALLASECTILARLMSTPYNLIPTPLVRSSKSGTQYLQSKDYAGLAKEMLAIMSSNQLLPHMALYDTYCAFIASLDFSLGQRYEDGAIGGLIDKFVASLHTASNTPRLSLNERFCSGCLAFRSTVAYSCRGRGLSWRGNSSDSLEVHSNRKELEECARSTGCSLCSLAADTVYEKSQQDVEKERQIGRKQIPRDAEADKGCQEDSPICLRLDCLDPGRMSSESLQLNVRLASEAAWSTGVYFELRGLDTSFGLIQSNGGTGSPQALGIAKQWLKTCKSSPTHSACQNAYTAFYPHGSCGTLPTRVVNVGSEHQDPFLFESAGLKANYCILSYCRGRPGTAITTKSNLPERIKGISLLSLPTLICEAILTARSLGFEYIWIDALCIVQDDEEDWAREVSLMHEWYSRAQLTITSLVAGDSRDSLYAPRPRRVMRPVPINFDLPKWLRPKYQQGRVTELAVFPESNFTSTALKSPVDQRAWTLQEQIMSTRILYFGAGLLHWECLHDYLLESDPYQATNTTHNANLRIEPSAFERRGTKCVVKGLTQEIQPDQHQTPFDVWKKLVKKFTQRKMTKSSDRIPAFLAISNVLAGFMKDEFVGGIWTCDNLVESLCWFMVQPDAMEPTAPSWTWAARAGEVSYEFLRHKGVKSQKASLVSCNAGADHAHSRMFGSITLKSTLSLLKPRETRLGIPSGESYDHVDGAAGSCYVFDMVSFEQGPKHSGFGMPLHPNGEPAQTIRLLLLPVNKCNDFQTASVFRRAGISMYEDRGHKIPKCLHWKRLDNGVQLPDWDKISWVLCNLRKEV